jgi:NADH-quinone oxidoreductase subunit H
MVGEIAWLILEAVLYPGLLFIVLMIIFTQWLYRKLSARIQYRRGPIHAGPFGILQPLADLIKLLSKEDVYNAYGLGESPLLVISVAIGALVAVTLTTPLATQPLSSPFDSVVVLYLLVLTPFALAYLAVSNPNPYTMIGVARYLALLIAAEPPFVMSFLTPLIIASRYYGADYSVYATSLVSWRIWLENPLAMALASISCFIGLMAILMVKPFDTPEAESEIYWGLFTELGGPRLALGMFAKFAERIVYPLFFTLLFLGGAWPVGDMGLPSILVILAKYLAVFVVLTIIDNSMPRYRPDQAVEFLIKYLYPLSILALATALLL